MRLEDAKERLAKDVEGVAVEGVYLLTRQRDDIRTVLDAQRPTKFYVSPLWQRALVAASLIAAVAQLLPLPQPNWSAAAGWSAAALYALLWTIAEESGGTP